MHNSKRGKTMNCTEHSHPLHRALTQIHPLGNEGVTLEYQSSSGSLYLTILHDWEQDDDGDLLDYEGKKVRISDHVLPPTYHITQGSADIEVGDHMDADYREWQAALAGIAERFGWQLTGNAAGQVTRYKNRIAKEAARRKAALDESRRAYAIASAASSARLAAIKISDELAEKAILIDREKSGSGRKRSLRRIADKYSLTVGELMKLAKRA